MRHATTAVMMAALLTAAGCGGEIEPGRRGAEAPVVRGLEVAVAEARALPGSAPFVGTVESPDRAVLTARVDGTVRELAVAEGEAVAAGELLAVLAGNLAGDRLAEARAALAGAGEERAAAAARLELARRTGERYRRLFAEEAVTPQEMDRVSAELEVAERALRGAQAGAEGAAAAVRGAETALAYNRVVAPYDGRVVRREVQVGSTVLPGTPLLVLDRAGGWRVRAGVPEALAGRLAPGAALAVELPALGRTLAGTVAEVLPGSDPGSRSFQIVVDLEPSEGLVAGLFARVANPFDAEQTVQVPAAAVVQRGQLTGVYAVEEGILRYRLVKTGRRLDGRVEILSGLRGGETVVAGGVERAVAGARLEE